MCYGCDSLPGTVFPEPGKDLHLPGVDIRRVLLVLECRRDGGVPPQPGKDRCEVEAAVGTVEFEVLVGDRGKPDVREVVENHVEVFELIQLIRKREAAVVRGAGKMGEVETEPGDPDAALPSV